MTNTGRITPHRCRKRDCPRLLFEGYLAPGTIIHIVCPKCGRMVIFTAPNVGLVDTVQQSGVYLNGTSSVLTAVTTE